MTEITQAQRFTEVFPDALVDVRNSSVAWGDYDNDGDLDILLTGILLTGFDHISKIYENTGNGFSEAFPGTLEDVSLGSVAWGDYDNDGDLDILLTGYNGTNNVSKIYENTGDGFNEVFAGELMGVIFGSVAWGDYDNDGDLDILLTGRAPSFTDISKIYENTGNGFSEVFPGILEDVGFPQSSVAWGDYDNDGDLDILLTGTTPNGNISKIYENTGNGFSEIFADHLEGVSGSVAWGDYDNDGDLDILLAGWDGIGGRFSKIYENTGNGFSEVFPGTLEDVGTSSVAWGDYDNDGDLDILLTGLTPNESISKIYRNTGNGFREASAGDLKGVGSGSVAWGDYDNDGDLDILLTGNDGVNVSFTAIYQNNAPTNTAPNAPRFLQQSVIDKDAILSWNAARDSETPAPGLTYNLRVGTTPQAEDVVSPMSLKDGFRQVIQQGNAGHNLRWTLKGLEQGIYYWSVQAVDHGFMGSVFSEERSFHIGFNKQDSLALVMLYNATDGPNWADNTNWLIGPVATWFGVTAGDHRVTALDLRANQLTGGIPPELGNLADLTILLLNDNLLSGNLPVSLTNLSNLETFNFSNTDLCELPDEVFQTWIQRISNLTSTGITCTPPNQAPVAPSVISPADGSMIIVGGTIGGDPLPAETPLEFIWTEASDPDGDSVTYTWQLSTSIEFDEAALLLSADTGSETRLEMDFGTLVPVLNQKGIGLGESLQLWQRVEAYDGVLGTLSNVAQVTFVRGTLVSATDEVEVPETYRLSQNHPNPFNTVTNIALDLLQPSAVTLKVYDAMGREITELLSEYLPAGHYELTWDGTRLASGVYMYTLQAGAFTETRRMLLLK